LGTTAFYVCEEYIVGGESAGKIFDKTI